MKTLPLKTIYFPENITAEVIEKELKNSFKEKQDSLIFDLRIVTWSDPYSLTLLLLWIKHLKEKGVHVEILLPALNIKNTQLESFSDEKINKKQRFLSFLVQMRFITVLESLGITYIPKDVSESNRSPKRIDSLISPFLEFSAAENLHKFLEALGSVEQPHLFFNDIVKYAVVETGKIRDVILRELGNNVFDHSGGSSGYLVMSRVLQRPFKMPVWEERFVDHLRKGDEYIELIISDKGKGIFTTLEKDFVLNNNFAESLSPTNLDVVEYAFLQYSTRKTDKERIKELLHHLEKSDQMEALPATGLYWVKETCREFNALLSVRSGNGILVYDFLSNPDQVEARRIEEVRQRGKISKMESFPGVQIKICFPLINTENKPKRNRPIIGKLEGDKNIYETIRLSSFFYNQDIENLTNQAVSLQKFLRKLQDVKHSKKKTIIVIDFEDTRLHYKTLFVIGVELMRSQDLNNGIVCINADSINRMAAELATFCEKSRMGSSLPKEKTVASFDADWNVLFLGASKNIENKLTSLIGVLSTVESPAVSDEFEDPDWSFISYLFTPNLKGNSLRLELAFSLSRLKKIVKANLASDVEKIIFTDKTTDDLEQNKLTRIYHPNQWFLIPSQVYCFGFFEVNKILERDASRVKILRWFYINLEEIEPDVVIFVGGIEVFVSSFDKQLEGRKSISIKDPDNVTSWMELVLLERHMKVVIISDVIGTGATLNKIIKKLPKVEVVKILTIVDARKDAELSPNSVRIDGTDFTVEAMLTFPINYESALPSGCKYEDVVIVDALTHSPIWNNLSNALPMWEDFDLFLEDIIKPSNGLLIGHFELQDKHILYLFLTPLIVEMFGHIIVEKITEDTKKTLNQMMKDQTIDYVFYPRRTPGADKVAKLICAIPEFVQSRLFGISNQMLETPLGFQWTQDRSPEKVIIFDDAVSSGHTLERMIDLAETWGAKSILVYILYNRGDSYQTRLLTKKTRHGGADVHIKFLTDLKIPIYNANDCPVCSTISELEHIQKNYFEKEGIAQELHGHETVAEYINTKIQQLRLQPVTFLQNNEFQKRVFTSDISRRITRCKFRRMITLGMEGDPEMRNSFARLVKGNNLNDILLFFQVLVKEKHKFYLNNVKAKEFFYTEFKKPLIKKAREFYLKNIQNLAPKELDACINVVRIIDEDVFLSDFNQLISFTTQDDTLFSVVLTNFLDSQKGQRLTSLLSDAVNSSLSLKDYQLSLFTDIQSNQNSPASIPERFEHILTTLHSSEGQGFSLFYLRLIIGSFIDGKISTEEISEKLSTQWSEIYSRISFHIVPEIKHLLSLFKAKKLFFGQSQNLATSLKELENYLQAANQLFEVLIDSSEQELSELYGLFNQYLEEIENLLYSENSNSLRKILRGMIPNFRELIQSLVQTNQVKNVINELGVKLKIDLPEENCWVFVAQSELMAIIFNLIDNLKHAFSDTSGNRRARIHLRKKDNYAYVTFKDNGKLKSPFRHNLGLQKVLSVATGYGGEFFPPSEIQESQFNTEVGFRLRIISEERLKK